MAIKKPFKELEIGDKIYGIKIVDSNIIHEVPSGNPIREYEIKEIHAMSNGNLVFSVDKNGKLLPITVDPIAYLKNLDTKSTIDSETNLPINRDIFSPSKQRLKDYVLWVLNINEMKVNDAKEECLTLLRRMANAKEELSNVEDDEEEEKISLIDAATMAL